jgi:hypothetical protein
MKGVPLPPRHNPAVTPLHLPVASHTQDDNDTWSLFATSHLGTAQQDRRPRLVRPFVRPSLGYKSGVFLAILPRILTIDTSVLCFEHMDLSKSIEFFYKKKTSIIYTSSDALYEFMIAAPTLIHEHT